MLSNDKPIVKNQVKTSFDKLITLTDSRYRLSVIVAKRARQLKKGIPSLLSADEYPKNRDGESHFEVAVAMQELLLDKGISWGAKLPTEAVIVKTYQDKQAAKLETYPPNPRTDVTPWKAKKSQQRPHF